MIVAEKDSPLSLQSPKELADDKIKKIHPDPAHPDDLPGVHPRPGGPAALLGAQPPRLAHDRRARPTPGTGPSPPAGRGPGSAGIITQNVDGLHQAGGARDVVELHGNLARIVCLDCGDVSRPRRRSTRRLTRGQPGLRRRGADGDQPGRRRRAGRRASWTGSRWSTARPAAGHAQAGRRLLRRDGAARTRVARVLRAGRAGPHAAGPRARR